MLFLQRFDAADRCGRLCHTTVLGGAGRTAPTRTLACGEDAGGAVTERRGRPLRTWPMIVVSQPQSSQFGGHFHASTRARYERSGLDVASLECDDSDGESAHSPREEHDQSEPW